MSGIVHAWKIDGNGQASPAAIDDFDEPLAEGYYWYHFDRNDPATQALFDADEGVDVIATRTLLAADTRPRTIVRGRDVLINLRGVNLNPGAQPEDMIPLRFFIQAGRVITCNGKPMKAIGDMVERLETQTVSRTPGGFIATFALAVIERMTPTITDLNEQVDELEDLIDSSGRNRHDQARPKVAELRREAILLRRYLAPQKDALITLSQQQLPWIGQDDQLRLRDAADQATRVAEELDAVRERCAIVKDQLTDIRAEQMNQNMMILSVVAAIFLPLGLISGMMGINVGGMPWVEAEMGFWYVTAIVVAIGLLQLALFRLLKWL
ncbi:zinc transporter ZntB [Algimonas porphyrae]|uniref:Transporter n=1 Tax=Algimonas porphyrae TaxID=1128113 RepID=A0ABQ5V448_9PROT|nr:zinc transporter ZntB [Algimonas porphyrae]GLQ21494.1 transporter [Algimonas porphyrae]